MSRYEQLLELIDQYKPRSLIETGVWNGRNAIRMINRACKYHAEVEYVGYDLFEDATAETDAEEFNVKGHNQERAVLAMIRSEVSTGASVLLMKGNTRETLNNNMKRDFAFIDGGHSIETIRHDYEQLSRCPIIVLDDYYTPDENGDCPDVTKYGCNQLIEEIGKNHSLRILAAKDPVKGGGYTQLVLICRQ